MQNREKIIIAALLIIIGILMGSMVTTYYLQGNQEPDNRQVRYVDIARTGLESPPPKTNAATTTSSRPDFQDVAKNVTPTVVYIESSIKVDKRGMPDDENHNFEDDFWDKFLPNQRTRAVGSGVIISSDGFILTNNHVVEGAGDRIKVTLNDKRAYKAQVIGRDPNTDLAILKIDADDLTGIQLGNSDYVEVGDWVLAIGNPFRLRSTVTAGIVSALSRQVQVINERLSVESFIQTDAAINRGNSGGALINARGELIGINTAIATETGNYEGYGFAVPVNLAMKVAKDIIEFGDVQRALLGVSIERIDYDRAMELGMDQVKGVEIVGIAADGAAQEFGLEAGNAILSVNGVETNEISTLQERIALQRPGNTVHLTIWKNGEVQELNVVLKGTENMLSAVTNENEQSEKSDIPFDIPQQDQAVFSVQEYDFGLTMVVLPSSMDFAEKELVVMSVKAESTADSAGFRKGQQIKRLNNNKLENLKSLNDLIKQLKTENRVANFMVTNKDGTTQDIEITF